MAGAKVILSIDVGGTSVKVRTSEVEEVRKHPSGPELTPASMVAAVREMTADWDYDAISVGFPGPVVNGSPAVEPRNLGPGWVGFDFEQAAGKPVRVINDAAMQALGSYDGGKMLFLGLGTGLGSAVVIAPFDTTKTLGLSVCWTISSGYPSLVRSSPVVKVLKAVITPVVLSTFKISP